MSGPPGSPGPRPGPPGHCAPHPPEFDVIQREATAEGVRCVVGAVLVNPRGEVFMQRRAPHVRLFPGCWDIVGGHVEAGETLCAALAREIAEETGWHLERAGDLIKVFDWEGSDGTRRREIDVLATVTGDLGRPRIERDKFIEAGWLDADRLHALAAASTDTGMVDLALRALALRSLRGNAPPTWRR